MNEMDIFLLDDMFDTLQICTFIILVGNEVTNDEELLLSLFIFNYNFNGNFNQIQRK